MATCTGRTPLRNDDGTHQRDDNGQSITRPCKANAIRGGTVCVKHGGQAPQVKAAARARVQQAEAQHEVSKLLGLLDPAQPITDPLTELGYLAGEVTRWKDILADRVAHLTQLRYEDSKGGEQLRSEAVLFERALSQCTQVLTAMARLNIDERLAAISERQADRVLRAIDLALEAAGVERAARGEAKLAAAKHLRSVA